MQNSKTFSMSLRFQLMFLAAFSLALGIGLVIWPFIFFGCMVMALPWGLLAVALLIWLAGLRGISDWRRKKRLPSLIGGSLFLIGGLLLLHFSHWRDMVLWYIFAAYLIFSAYCMLRPAWLPGVEKQSFARWIGALTVWGFVVLLLFMPRSGLSDALQLLGVFTAGWGAYQLLLPPHQA